MTTSSYTSSGAMDTTYGTGPLVPDQKETHNHLPIKSLEVWSPCGEQTFLNFKERLKTSANLDYIKCNLTDQVGHINDAHAVIEQRMSNTKTLNRYGRNTSESKCTLSPLIKNFDPCHAQHSPVTPIHECGVQVNRNIMPAFD